MDSPRQIVIDDLEGGFAEAIDETVVPAEEGTVVSGTVVRAGGALVLLDISRKGDGIIPSCEVSTRNDVSPNAVLRVGDHVDALVLLDLDGCLILSKKRAEHLHSGRIEEIADGEAVACGPVVDEVKDGLILDLGDHPLARAGIADRGFLAASLVELHPVYDLAAYLGRVLDAKVIGIDHRRKTVLLSRCAWLRENWGKQRWELLSYVKPGQVCRGVVSKLINHGPFVNLRDVGALVDLGGVDGLIHISELSWTHVNDPTSIVNVGEEVDVQVLDIDHDRQRFNLSLKATQQAPWQQFHPRQDAPRTDVASGYCPCWR